MTAFDLDALLKRHPLPWVAHQPTRVTDFAYVMDAHGIMVGRAIDDNDAARLLAAAPGMVKAILVLLEDDEAAGAWTALKESLP